MKWLQPLDVPVSVADEVVKLMNAVAAGAAVTARPVVAIAPVAAVLAAAAVVQQAMTASVNWTGTAAVIVCGQEMEAERAGLAPAENLTVVAVTAAVMVGQAAIAAAAVTVVMTVSEPGSETRTVICHE